MNTRFATRPGIGLLALTIWPFQFDAEFWQALAEGGIGIQPLGNGLSNLIAIKVVE